MPDDSLILSALVVRFRAKLAAAPPTITLAEINAAADAALAALTSGKDVVNINFEGGGTGFQMNCNPSLMLAACNQILGEQSQTKVGTGTTHIDLSTQRIET